MLICACNPTFLQQFESFPRMRQRTHIPEIFSSSVFVAWMLAPAPTSANQTGTGSGSGSSGAQANPGQNNSSLENRGHNNRSRKKLRNNNGTLNTNASPIRGSANGLANTGKPSSK